jgi:hypothetical protein
MSSKESSMGQEVVSARAPEGTNDYSVIDTETHTFLRCWPIESSPQASLVDPFTRTAFGGDVLIAEMDRAGVDVALVIGYDGYDFSDFMVRHGSTPADFMGGRAFTHAWVKRFPDRLRYISTLRDPRVSSTLLSVERELAAGAIGLKIFPAYLRLLPDAPELRAVFDVLGDHGAGAVFGFEDIQPPSTPSLIECYEALARLAETYAVPIQVNHGGNAAIDGGEFEVLCRVANACTTVLISTSFLGGTRMEWPDEWRFPFATYLQRLRVYAESIRDDALAWGSDWPWLEGVAKYPQLLAAVSVGDIFESESALRGYLGGNASRHWRFSAEEIGVARENRRLSREAWPDQ